MVLKILGREHVVSKEFIIFIVPFALIFFGLVGLLIDKKGGTVVFNTEGVDKPQINAVVNNVDMDMANPPQEKKQEDEIQVYVVGCVNNPGIVTLKKGQIIDDAIKSAGGATAEADLGNINLVYKLKENVTLKILSKSDSQNTGQIITDTSKANQPAIESNNTSAMEFVAEAGSGIVIDNGSGGQQKNGGKVNINTASIEQLDTLPGIGAETAKDIISFREKNGGFKTIEDIMKIPGIKDSKFGKIKDTITAD